MSTRNVSYTQFIMYTHNTSIVYVYARCKGQPCNDITENNLKLNISSVRHFIRPSVRLNITCLGHIFFPITKFIPYPFIRMILDNGCVVILSKH